MTDTIVATEILGPFMHLDMSLGDRYNSFYAMMTKFAVKSCASNSSVVFVC